MFFNSQAGQDLFVLKATKEKKDGTFVELGSWQPIEGNNTYILENEYNWRGLMVERDGKWLNSYETHRPNSKPMIGDALSIDYEAVFDELNFPVDIDYLSLDLEPQDRSALVILEKLEKEVMSKYKFGVVTYEHAIYLEGMYKEDWVKKNLRDTLEISREIFKNHGYFRAYSNVANGTRLHSRGGDGGPFEDWYVHPDLVDTGFIDEKMTLETEHFSNEYEGLQWSDIVENMTDPKTSIQRWSNKTLSTICERHRSNIFG